MERLRAWGISQKLWLAMTVLILGVLGGLSFVITWLFGDFYLEQKLATLKTEASDISAQLAPLSSWSEYIDVLNSIKLPSDTQLMLLNRNGEVVAVAGDIRPTAPHLGMGWRYSAGRGMMGGWEFHALRPSDFLSRDNLAQVLAGKTLAIRALPASGGGKAMLIAAVPLGSSPVEGVVLLGSSPEPLEESISTFRRLILYASLVAVAMAAIVSLFIARHVTRPLAVMQKAATRMANGEFNQIENIGRQDELGQLAEALNKMSASLKNHMEMLSQEKRLLQGIVEGMSDGVIMLATDGKILYANESAKSLWSEGEIENTQRKNDIMGYIAQMVNTAGLQERLHTVTFGTQVLQVVATPMTKSDADQGFIVVLRDVTASLRAEKSRRDFLASVTHELRTPLHLIQGYLEAIQDGVIPASEFPEHIELVLDEVKRLARLVQDLQDIGSLNRELNLKNKEIDIKAFIQDLRHRFQSKAQQLGVTLEFDIHSSTFKGDPDRLFQVFINLLDNALRYTPAGRTIRVTSQEEQDHILFSVEDEGEGIPAEALPHIFERFYRVDKARSRKDGGMGLGLAIVKQIVEAHQGSIQVESELGKGTVFYIRLPKG